MRASFSRQDKESPVVEGHPLDRAYKTGRRVGVTPPIASMEMRSRGSPFAWQSYSFINLCCFIATGSRQEKALIPFVGIRGLAVLLIRRCASFVKNLG